MKTKINNLIILDESGSMQCVCQQTISGCNETINTIKSSQKEFEETQEHYVSIYAFQSNESCPSHYIVKNQPANAVEHITPKDYRPWGGTPLYDAIGGTLADLRAVVAGEEQAVGSVTIITDGYENASRQYTQAKVVSMIRELKEKGWNFNFIGANIDVERAAKDMGVDNYMRFEQSAEGTGAMFEKENRSRRAYYQRMESVQAAAEASRAEKERLMREASKGYFNEENPEKPTEKEQKQDSYSENMKTVRFQKESDGLWYVDLPSWPFAHGHLLMVGGSDDLCEFLSDDKKSVTVKVVPSNAPLEGMKDFIKLTRLNKSLTGGAHYSVENCQGFTKNVYFCPVTLFVLHKYPRYMYVKK